MRVKSCAGDWIWQVGEEVGEQSGRATVRHEENGLREHWWWVLLVRRPLRSLARVSALLFRLLFSLWWIEREMTGESAEIDKEVDEVHFTDLRGYENVFLGEAGRSGDSARSMNQQEII